MYQLYKLHNYKLYLHLVNPLLALISRDHNFQDLDNNLTHEVGKYWVFLFYENYAKVQ